MRLHLKASQQAHAHGEGGQTEAEELLGQDMGREGSIRPSLDEVF